MSSEEPAESPAVGEQGMGPDEEPGPSGADESEAAVNQSPSSEAQQNGHSETAESVNEEGEELEADAKEPTSDEPDPVDDLQEEGWEEGHEKGARTYMTVRQDGQLSLSPPVCEDILGEPGGVRLHFNEKKNAIGVFGLDEYDEDNDKVRSPSTTESNRLTVGAAAFLKEYQVDFDETVRYFDVEEHDEYPMAIIHLDGMSEKLNTGGEDNNG